MRNFEVIVVGVVVLAVVVIVAIVAAAIAAVQHVAVSNARADAAAASMSDMVGRASVDGVLLADGDRVLVMSGDGAGLYTVAGGAPSRAWFERWLPQGQVITIGDGGLRFGGTTAVLDRGSGGGGAVRFIPQLMPAAMKHVRARLAEHRRVPTVIHQVYGLWDLSPMPPTLQANRQKWRDAAPGMTMRLWNRADCEQLLAEKFADLAPVWRGFARKCQQADLARYMILAEHGGWYLDLDAVPSDRCVSLPTGESTLLTETVLSADAVAKVTYDEPIRHGVPEHPVRVSNYAMGFTPGHPFWPSVFRLIKRRAKERVKRDYDVIYTTGPDVISTAYHSHQPQHGWPLTLLDRAASHDLVQHHAAGGWRHSADA